MWVDSVSLYADYFKYKTKVFCDISSLWLRCICGVYWSCAGNFINTPQITLVTFWMLYRHMKYLHISDVTASKFTEFMEIFKRESGSYLLITWLLPYPLCNGSMECNKYDMVWYDMMCWIIPRCAFELKFNKWHDMIIEDHKKARMSQAM
jgi:hypothetical protein